MYKGRPFARFAFYAKRCDGWIWWTHWMGILTNGSSRPAQPANLRQDAKLYKKACVCTPKSIFGHKLRACVKSQTCCTYLHFMSKGSTWELSRALWSSLGTSLAPWGLEELFGTRPTCPRFASIELNTSENLHSECQFEPTDIVEAIFADIEALTSATNGLHNVKMHNLSSCWTSFLVHYTSEN